MEPGPVRLVATLFSSNAFVGKRMRLAFLFTLAVLLILVPHRAEADDYPERTWTNDVGETIEARLVRVSGATAILDKAGEIIRAPIGRLSDADKDWIKLVREVGRWREWTMADGTTRRAKLESVEDNELAFKDMDTEFELTIDGLSDSDRQLLEQVYGSSGPAVSVSDFPDNGAATNGVEAVTRDFTDIRGKTITAEYRGLLGDKVVLYFQDREWQVPITQFSATDRQWVTETEVASAAPPGTDTLAAAEMLDGMFTDMSAAERIHSETMARHEQLMNESMSRGDQMRAETEARMAESRQRMEAQREENQRQWAERQEQIAGDREQREQEQLAASTANSGFEDDEVFDSPSTSPSYGEPTYPTGGGTEVIVYEYQCYSCNHKWESTRDLGVGDKCPKCGIRFDAMEDENGNIVEESSGYRVRRWGRLVKLAVFLVLGVCGFVAKMARS